jgi:rod shape-determining protein MreB and related proteins
VRLLRYFQPIVYVTLQPDTLSVRDVSSGRNVTEPPFAAISREPKKRLLGVGEAARVAAATQPADLVNPFKHPRSLLSDFTVAEVIIKGFVKKLFDGRLFVGSPIVVLHPRVNPEGGFTQIEIRALRELAIGAGASKAFVWHGRDLTDDELLSLKFDSGGEVLN